MVQMGPDASPAVSAGPGPAGRLVDADQEPKAGGTPPMFPTASLKHTATEPRVGFR